MTLHWWMHWFWITVVSLLLTVPLSRCAPYPSAEPQDGEVIIPVLSTDAPHRFHSDASLYVALVHDSSASSPTFLEPDTDDTPVPSALFPFPTDVSVVHEQFTTPDMEVTEEPSPKTLDDNPIEHELLSTDSDDANSETKMFPRDIGRNAKAIGRDYVASTPDPQVVNPLGSNHNPFISEKEDTSQEMSKKLVVPATISPVLAEEKEEAHQSDATVAPKEQEAPLSTTVAPDLADKTDMDASPEEHVEVSVSPVVPSLGPPSWVPSFSSEDESNEEAEAEENARPPDASLEQQPTELDDNDISSEAVTKGRMTAEQGLDAPSIVGIILGLIGLVAIVGVGVGFVLYRRQFLNKPQTLNDKCSNADSSGYIDDTLRVSAARMNGDSAGRKGNRVTAAESRGRPLQIMGTLSRKDNSEEMYSLDNDSFLNSLEAMTIQNYWTDSVKHTKL